MKVATKLSGIALATAAAALFVAAPVSTALADAGAASPEKCMGGNSCKGQSSCKTAHNACKGQNSCKGTGFIMATAADCAKAGGKIEISK
jgi:hypothetical protein